MAPKKSLPDYYREAVPSSEAMFRFAPERLARAYRWAVKRDFARGAVATLEQIAVLKDDMVPTSTKEVIANSLKIDLRHPPDDPFCRRDPSKYKRVRRSLPHHSEYTNRLYFALRDAMRGGQFVAIGYELPRTSKSELVVIPRDVLESPSEMDLSDSYLCGNGLEYIAVRLLPSVEFDSELFAKKQRGRRSREPEILSTYDRLLADGVISTDDTLMAVSRKIQKALVESTGLKSGLSHDAIGRAVKSPHTEAQKSKIQKG
jgi:hypothetical protein